MHLRHYKRLERAFSQLGYGSPDTWVASCIAAGLVLFFAAIVLAEGAWLLAGALAALFLPFGLLYSAVLYLASLRTKRIEADLPETLFLASSLSCFMPLDEIIGQLGEREYGELSRGFAAAHSQIHRGATVESALRCMAEGNDSPDLARAVELLLQGYTSGADISTALKETAEDISRTGEIIRGRKVSATVEKYTLLLAGGAIVPFILGMLISLVGALPASGLESIGIGADSAVRQAILSNAVLGNQIYLLEYALLAAIFVAYQEGCVQKAVVYAGVLVPMSLALFHLAQSFPLLA